jgi:hypothetical protein
MKKLDIDNKIKIIEEEIRLQGIDPIFCNNNSNNSI